MATNRVYGMILPLVLVFATFAHAQTFTVLHNFNGFEDGYNLVQGVVADQDGNLYGTTWQGGDLKCANNPGAGCGVVFKLNSSGSETVLHRFAGPPDGVFPETAVVRDGKGNLYATATQGGAGSYYGAVFKIDTAGKETTLFSFAGVDGSDPYQSLITDKAGNLYGTTQSGGPSGGGTIFKLDPAGNETVLHNFAGGASDGLSPQWGHLTRDESGNLYGVAPYGGTSNNGVLYELTKGGTFKVLHSFAGQYSDGCWPAGTVSRDKSGNLYGATISCGAGLAGTLWKVSKQGTETILHSFAGGTSDGCYPQGGPVRDSKGNLYGVTDECGANGYGALYEVSANGSVTLLHSFDGTDGSSPEGEVARTGKGELFGVTFWGGTGNCQNGCGTVWKYVP